MNAKNKEEEWLITNFVLISIAGLITAGFLINILYDLARLYISGHYNYGAVLQVVELTGEQRKWAEGLLRFKGKLFQSSLPLERNNKLKVIGKLRVGDNYHFVYLSSDISVYNVYTLNPFVNKEFKAIFLLIVIFFISRYSINFVKKGLTH